MSRPKIYLEKQCEHGYTGDCDQRRWRGSYGQYEDCPGGFRKPVDISAVEPQPFGVTVTYTTQ